MALHLLRAVLLFLASAAAWSQPGPPFNRQQPQPPQQQRMNGPWWRSPQAERAGIFSDQRKKMEELWQQHRLRRIDLEATVQKAQVTLEPLWIADPPDEAAILAQTDRVFQAQAEVRKDEVHLRLAVCRILGKEQWRRLNEPHGLPLPGETGNPPPPTPAR